MASALLTIPPRSAVKMQYPAATMQNYYDEQQGYGDVAPVLWHLAAYSGVRGHFLCQRDGRYEVDYRYLPYTVRPGEERVLSRWNMLQQKVAVSRVQCKVQVATGGAAFLLSCGKGPTLWRQNGGQWYALNQGESTPLAEGDQVSLDWNNPEAAIFMCHVESAMPHAHATGYGEQGLPHPWERLVDQNGAVYYSNPQTGEASWDPPGALPTQHH